MTVLKRISIFLMAIILLGLFVWFVQYVTDGFFLVTATLPSASFNSTSQPIHSEWPENSTESETMATSSDNPTPAPDLIPPQIHGAVDLVVEVGTQLAYLDQVTATDDRDAQVELSVDNQQVNLAKAGVYPLIYQASDSAGNITQVEVTVTVLTFLVDPELLRQEAHLVLEKILNDDMAPRDQAYAIYRYVHDNIIYTGHSDKSSEDNAAYDGLVRGYGDCFTYFATARLLLTEAGIDNLPVSRLDGVLSTDHYWNLINLGDGWYHFDATPHNLEFPFDGFMRTDAELAAYYTERHGSDYYAFDHSLYPATPEN